ncbi:MAG: winged helix-turn-helix domain-containing protein [Pseudomonadota bacterium]
MSVYQLGAATVDSAARTIIINGESRRLSLKSANVLAALVEASGDVVSRDQLIARVWPDVCVGEEVLTQAIAELRRAFEDNPRTPQFIATVPKTGYRLAADIAACETFKEALLPPLNIDPETSIDAITSYYSAYELFDRGGSDQICKAVELCRKSIDADQTFAPAHALLSAALAYRELYYGKRHNTIHDALAAAQRAITCDRTAPEGYAAQGFALAQLGDFDHAVTSFNAAMRLRPDSYFLLLSFGRVLYARGAYQAASRLFDRAARICGDEFHGLMLSATSTRAAGDVDRATAKLKRAAWRCNQRLLEDPEDLRALICRTYCQINAEGVASAEPLLTQLNDNHDPLTYYVVPALARAGETTLALDRFEAIVDNGWADPHFLSSDRDLDPLRGERRFQKIANALAA